MVIQCLITYTALNSRMGGTVLPLMRSDLRSLNESSIEFSNAFIKIAPVSLNFI